MSGLAECFQKPHFQQAHSTSCLWHKKKGKIEAPSERLGTKPLIPRRACQRGGAGENTGAELRAWAFHTPALLRETERLHKSAPAFLSQRRQISPQRRGQTEETASAQRRSRRRAHVCAPAVPDKGLRHLLLTQEKGFLTLTVNDPDPKTESQRAVFCSDCQIVTAAFCEHSLNAKR